MKELLINIFFYVLCMSLFNFTINMLWTNVQDGIVFGRGSDGESLSNLILALFFVVGNAVITVEFITNII